MDEYARFGIRFYWLIDPQQRAIEIYAQGTEGSYARQSRASSGLVEDVPGCPGLRLDLDAMWAKVDALDNV